MRFPTGAGEGFGVDVCDTPIRFAARPPVVRSPPFGDGPAVGRNERRRPVLSHAPGGRVGHGPFDGSGDVLSVVEALSVRRAWPKIGRRATMAGPSRRFGLGVRPSRRGRGGRAGGVGHG